ncbi:hypothetical protein BST97_04525 [Nonlabens spongiae]|uniref:PKD domain-containing protein n=1 Tax=Nonlabens spongiae TaxID=331648 RepID=A0A1W6MI79_9FLAO|nr:T9SS type B sorting domain-containing protein [Nonlabens spongiae]ARN77305.1 hypothetical protein BST97_04525 [Nonlabens spongiae]
MKKLYPLLFIIFLPAVTLAQGEAAWWFFGENAVADFNGGAPISNQTGSLNTLEGCSSISDSCGNLLFYSDGETVYDSSGGIMQGGTGLSGNPSAAQSGIIVPDLRTPNLYYIFTISGGERVRYSLVDINANGGLGAVLRTNIPLSSSTSHEKVTAVLHADGDKFWVMTYNNNQYRAYIAAAGGIQAGSEVISNINSSLTDARGSLKFSPDGTKVANTSVGDGAVVADFDSSTGIVSNQRVLDLGRYSSAYGVEFSPESNVLYVDANESSAGNTCTVSGERAVLMYDMTVPNGNNNPTTLFTQASESRGALQLGIDQKVYVARSCQPFLGAISNPNDIGLATYDDQALRLRTPSVSREGLPPFITSFFNPAFYVNGVDPTNPNFNNSLDICENSTVTFESINSDYCTNPAPTFFWDFGDGNTSNQENPTHTYTAPGTYTVIFSVTNFNFTKTVEATITVRDTSFIANAVGDVFVFDSNNDGSEPKDLSVNETPLILGSQDPNIFEVTYHLTQNEAEAGTAAQSQPQTFALGRTEVWARVTNTNLPADSQCYAVTSFDVIVSPFTGAQQPDDLIICDDNNDGFNEFDLTQTINQVTGGAGALFNVTFHETETQAQNGGAQIPNPADYDNQVAYNDRVYIRMEDTQTPPQPTTTTFVDLIVADTPVANAVMDMRYCDTDNDNSEPVDLDADFTGQVLNGQTNPDYRVTYHLTQLQADEDTDALNTPFDLTTTTTIYVRIDNDTQNICADTSQSFTLFLDRIPTANTVAEYRLCDDLSNNGAESFDLFSRNGEVLGSNQAATDFDIEYFTSQSDADLGSLNGAIPLAQNYSSAGQTVFVRIENVLNRNCYDTTSFDLIVDDRPFAVAPTTDLELCDDANDGVEAINLSNYDTQVLGGQTNPNFDVSYHATQAEADAGSPELSQPYDIVLGSNTIFARVENSENTSCPDTVEFTINLSAQAIANSVNDYRICDLNGDDVEIFTLSSRNPEILGSNQNANQFNIEYFADEADARLGTLGGATALPDNYLSATTTIFARIENVDNRNCAADPIAINLFVDEIPEIQPIATVQDCDDDGVKDVDLSSYNSQILADPSNPDFDVTYHANQNDANTGDSPLSSPYQITPSTPTIYARVFNINNPQGCAETTSFNIEISQRPVANTVQDYVECDDLDNNLEKEIDLSQFYTEILGDQNPADYDISFYASSDDAQNSDDSLPVLYNVGENGSPETIFVRIEAVTFSDCAAFTDFEITITPRPEAFPAPDMTFCDNEPFDRSESFNLGDQDSAILFGQDNQLFNVSYHASQSDANTGADPLPKQDYFNTRPNQIIYARIENAAYPELCPDFTEFTLTVFNRPEIRDQGPIVICAGVPETIDAGPGYASYEWSTGETTRTIDVVEGGQYTVTVFNDDGCESTATIRVRESDIATITEVIVEQFEVKRNKIKVIAEGPGSYIYSLDDFVYQSEPLFDDLRPGFYEVYVRDENGCGTVSEEVVIIGGPAFFTPNQDGYNDTWQIIAGETVPDARVSIFDRYGKLITSIAAGSQGWDGTFNGTPLPSTDYWYTVELEDGRSFKGHFALKR